jgi:hypothetical protein
MSFVSGVNSSLYLRGFLHRFFLVKNLTSYEEYPCEEKSADIDFHESRTKRKKK